MCLRHGMTSVSQINIALYSHSVEYRFSIAVSAGNAQLHSWVQFQSALRFLSYFFLIIFAVYSVNMNLGLGLRLVF